MRSHQAGLGGGGSGLREGGRKLPDQVGVLPGKQPSATHLCEGPCGALPPQARTQRPLSGARQPPAAARDPAFVLAPEGFSPPLSAHVASRPAIGYMRALA